MGKYIYSLGEQGLFESIRPVGLPLILGFFWNIGVGTVFVYQTIIFLFSLGVLFLMFFLGKEIFSEEAGIFACFILVLTPFFFQSSISIMTEIPAVFFILLSIVFFVTKKHSFIIGITAGIAFLFKFPAGLMMLSVLLLFIIQYTNQMTMVLRNYCFFLLGFFIVQFPFFLFNYFQYRADTATLVDAIFRPLILGSGHAGNAVHEILNSWENIFYYVFTLVLNNPLLLLGFFGCILVLFSNHERKKEMVLFVPLFVFFVYFTSIVNKQLRFAIFFLPFLALFAGQTLQLLLSFSSGGKTVKKLLLLVLLFGSFTLFSFVPGFTSVYRFYPEEVLPIEEGYYSYFSDIKFTGTILTTEPYFTAYSDGILAYPYYNNVTDAVNIYQKYTDDAVYVVFTSSFYPCSDDFCREQISLLRDEIAATHSLVYQQEWNGEVREIFKK